MESQDGAAKMGSECGRSMISAPAACGRLTKWGGDLVMRGNQPMKKLAVSAAIVVVFAFYSLLHARAMPVALTPRTSTGATGATPAPTSSDGSGATPGATSTGTSGYKDGTYTGSVADAQWGYVQVQATIQGGKITNVTFLQYPNDRNRSIEINQYADPQLVSEAIQAQSANVDIVTGATDSSEAFIQSLSDALTQAQG